MTVTWDLPRYQRYYTGAPQGTLAYDSARFAVQAQALIDRYGLTPADGLVIVGDGWGGLGTAFAALGFTVELTEASQYIIDNWDTYGSPAVAKPTNTDSYTPVSRSDVRSQERNTAITDWWCIVADCAGDDADVSRWAGLNDPDTGYTSGRGKAIHIITPLAEWTGAKQEPDNVWQSIAAWEAAFQGLARPQEVLSAHGIARTAGTFQPQSGARSQASEVPKTSVNASFPHDVPGYRSNNGPFTTGGEIYIATRSETGPRMTYLDGDAGSYLQIGDPEPAVGDRPISLSSQLLANGDIICGYHIGSSEAYSVYASLYDAVARAWSTTALVTTNNTGQSAQGVFIVESSTGALYLLCNIDVQAIMGTNYACLGVFKSIDGGATWGLVVNPTEGLQIDAKVGIMILGDADRLHLCYADNAGPQQIIQTVAAEVAQTPWAVAAYGYRELPWGVKRSSSIHFIYEQNGVGLCDINFISADDPSAYTVDQIDGAGSGYTYGAALYGSTIYVAWELGTGNPVYLSNDRGGSWTNETFLDGGDEVATVNARGAGVGVQCYDGAQAAKWYWEADITPGPPLKVADHIIPSVNSYCPPWSHEGKVYQILATSSDIASLSTRLKGTVIHCAVQRRSDLTGGAALSASVWDGTETGFVEMDAANRPTITANGAAAVYYARLNLVTGLWDEITPGNREILVHAPADTDSMAGTDMEISEAGTNAGRIGVLYQKDKNLGNRADIGWHFSDDLGVTWTPGPDPTGATRQQEYRNGRLLMARDGMTVHMLGVEDQTTVYLRTLNLDTMVIQDRQNPTTDIFRENFPVGAGVIVNRGGKSFARFPVNNAAGNMSVLQFESTENPTVFSQQEIDPTVLVDVSESPAQSLAVYGDHVHAVALRELDGRVFSNNDQGADDWSAPRQERERSANGTEIFARLVTYQNSARIGMALTQPGGTWYLEYFQDTPVSFTALVQWTLATPQDFEAWDVMTWQNTPYRPEPTTGEMGGQDEIKGWVMAGNIQGVEMGADHYYVDPIWDPTREVWCARFIQWNNDPGDWTADEMWAEEWTFHPLTPDDQFGGQYNTVQSVVVYCAPGSFEWKRDPAVGRTVKDAAEFIEPQVNVRHGVWVTNESFDAHKAVQTPYDWQSWMSDLPQADQDRARELPYWGDPPMF